MSDPRSLAQAELVSLIAGTDNCGVAEVLPSTSLRTLVNRDANGNLPAIGVRYSEFHDYEDEELGSSYRHRLHLFEVYIVDRNGRGGPDAVASVFEILGRVDARVDGQRSAIPPLWTWEVSSGEVEEYETDGAAAVLSVSLVIQKAAA